MPEITEAQRKTLKELRDFIASRKYPPTMSELGDRLGVAAASAHQLVKQLERKGYVTREARKARSLSVVRDPEDRPEKLVPVPLIGSVAAGPALLAEENHIGDVLIDQSIAGTWTLFRAPHQRRQHDRRGDEERGCHHRPPTAGRREW